MSECVYVCVRVCLCVCVRERYRKNKFCVREYVLAYVREIKRASRYVLVCVLERGREREKEREREREREREGLKVGTQCALTHA